MKFNVNIKKIGNSFMAHIETNGEGVTILSENLEKIYEFIDKKLERVLNKKGGEK